MAVATDSKVGLYFIGLIFVGLAIGGIVGINQTRAYWTNFCAERQDIEECKLIETEPHKAIVALIKLGDQYGSHAAIPATPPKEAAQKSN
jgi:hypothetical protein